jgi:ABC-2 type transport system ATP-binding protein
MTATALEVNGVHKSFRLPVAQMTTLKEQALHPLTRQQYRELKVLEDISLEVDRGEFFGIVGRNASGKSTLLKLIASVYRADRGHIRVAGTIAPVIELGVGFQGQLTARENVTLNALMMGLTPREARYRFDAVIEFAELQDYVHMKLMNYSTGMQARLAFAIAMQTDPDVLLLDEVLAVGDPPFQRRCEDAFSEMKRKRSRTVLLVTHSTAQLTTHCDRAMLLEGGAIELLGEPPMVAARYQQLQSTAIMHAAVDGGPGSEDEPASRTAKDYLVSPVQIESMRTVDSKGSPTDRFKPGRAIYADITVRATGSVDRPRLGLQVADQTSRPLFHPPLIELAPETGALQAGEAVRVAVKIENKLAPGRYGLAAVTYTGEATDGAGASQPAALQFEVPQDGRGLQGFVALDYDYRLRPAGEKRTRGKARSAR